MTFRKLTTIALLFAALSAAAQESTPAEAFTFLRLDRSPATQALAGAGFSFTDNAAYAAFGNPAASAFMNGTVDAGISYRYWSPLALNEHHIAAGFSVKPTEVFAVTAGYSRGIQPALEGETFRPSDNIFGVGLALAVSDNFSIGVNGHYAMQQLMQDYRISGFAADAIVQYHTESFNVAAGVMSLGPKVKSERSGEYPLPTSVKLALDYTFAFDEAASLALAADGDYYFSGNFGVSAGASLTLYDIFILRAGGRYATAACALPTHIAVGAGVKYGHARLDISYVTLNQLIGNSLMGGVSFNF